MGVIGRLYVLQGIGLFFPVGDLLKMRFPASLSESKWVNLHTIIIMGRFNSLNY